MKTAEQMLRGLCHDVMDDLFPPERDRKADPKVVEDQLFELQKLALGVQHVALEARAKAARAKGSVDKALWETLWEIIR